MITIYHNNRCSKSREALMLLQAKGYNPTVIHYLETAPTEAELTTLLAQLGLTPRQLLRTKEVEFQTLGLEDPTLSDLDIIRAMSKSPRLIERPIVVFQDKAIIARPASLLEGFC